MSVFLFRCAVLFVVALLFRRVLDALDARHGARGRRGIAPPARQREEPLLPFGCGCCGQDCPEGRTWCLACEPHVGITGPLCARTYYSLHGVDCPFAVRPIIEETRLMPGAEQRDPGDENDQVPEGLGIPGSPHIKRAWPSHVHAHAPLDPSTKRALEELEREAHS